MIRFIVNPTAGANRTRKKWPILESHARSVLGNFDVVFTEYHLHAIKIAEESTLAGFDPLVAVGGDGTINEVVNGIYLSRKNITLGIVECGTGADFARTIPVGSNYIKAIDTLKSGIIRNFDIVEVEYTDFSGNRATRVFVNAADAGLGGDTVINVDGAPKVLGGKLAFLYGVLRSLVNLKTYKISLTIDGKSVGEFEIISTVVANGKYFAGGMFIAPMARADDGKLEIILIKKTTRRRFMRNLPLVYKGKHIYIEEVELFSGREIVIRSSQEVMLEMDGELVGKLPAIFRVKENFLKIITKREV